MFRGTALLIAIASFIAGTANGSCSSVELHACGLKAHQLDPSTLLSNKHSITEMCGVFNETKTCFSTLSECPPEVETQIAPVRQLLSSLFTTTCSDETSRQTFEESSRCLQDNSQYLDECTKTDNKTAEAFSAEECKHQETMWRCYIKRVGEKCTEKAKTFAIKILKELENIANEQCDPKISIDNGGTGTFLNIWMMLGAFVFVSAINHY